MSRTFSGLLFYSAANINLPTALTGGATAGNYLLVRNALGDVSLNNNAGAATVQFWLDIADVKRPFLNFFAQPGQGNALPLTNELQEVFGNAAGGPGNPLGPGFSGTPAIPWGLALFDVVAVYSVVTAALTAATLSVNRTTYTENVAFTNTAVLAPTAIALTTTTSATTPHVQKVSLAQPLVFEVNDNSNLSVELSITAAATSAIRVYGMGAHVAVEYS
jgi:hypothetical protein